MLALITASFAPERRARAMGWFGAVMGLGGVCGQVLGGLLLQADLFGLGWRTIFLVNVPVGVPAALLATRVLPRAEARTAPRLDVAGVLGVSSGLGLALAPLVLGREEGWPLWTWLSLGASLPVLAATLLWERRTAEPVVDLALFRVRRRVLHAGRTARPGRGGASHPAGRPGAHAGDHPAVAVAPPDGAAGGDSGTPVRDRVLDRRV
ncbi:MFS transporter [Actinomadura oligospora]|uniref:MFS transporter n=1 Tax=Actinomadura oligospora TaxID=111804 RepID=UPI0004B00301|nr:MFS transporter [Actinomadura oligospora]